MLNSTSLNKSVEHEINNPTAHMHPNNNVGIASTQSQPSLLSQNTFNPSLREPTVLHETVVGSPVTNLNTHTTGHKATITDVQRELNQKVVSDGQMKEALAAENDRIASNLKTAADQRENLAKYEALKAPGSAVKAKTNEEVAKHTNIAANSTVKHSDANISKPIFNEQMTSAPMSSSTTSSHHTSTADVPLVRQAPSDKYTTGA